MTNIIFDSAGTSNYHSGNPPDQRSIDIAQKHGIDISKQVSRQVSDSDFVNFDYILAMDRDNFANLIYLSPAEYQNKIHLLLDFLPDQQSQSKDVPDPYFYKEGFQMIYDLIYKAVGRFLEQLPS